MKVILINSPLFREYNPLYDEDSLPPIGLGYIGTHLRSNGIDTSLIDAVDQKIPLSNLIDQIACIKPNFIGINIFTTNYELVKEFVEGLKFKTHIVVGGLSTKQLYENILIWNTPNPIDIVTGDGEWIMPDIVKGCVQEQPYYQKDNRRVFRIEQNSKYLVQDISNVALDRSFFLNEPVIHPLGFVEANIVASRGCIYNCSFCAAARSLNKEYPVRERSSESLIAELQDISNKYSNVNSIRVLDDLFLKSNQSIKKAIEVFTAFAFQWRSMAHVQTFRDVDEELMQRLKQSGCQELFIGIESGSPKILGQINKTRDIATIVGNLTKVFKAGINMKGYFIYGFPDETDEDMEQTYQLALKLKNLASSYHVNFRTSVFQYRPYHSTQIYHELEGQGKNMRVSQIAANEALSGLVGRLQFNFHSGNYSAAAYEVVERYIYATTNLNGNDPFAALAYQSEAL